MSSETVTESDQSPSQETEELLTDHSYDGIQEFDNPLPGWWKFVFWLTILFAPLYWAYFEGGASGRSIHDQYDRQADAVFTMKFKEIGTLQADRETILEYMEKPDWLTVGKVVYKTNCASCHGPEGGGNVGPNLSDDYWKHVKNVEDIANVIEEGAANGAMPAWKNRLSHPNQIVLTASYIASLRKNPVDGKAAEGNKIPDWNAE